jgi:hypothetical protein
MEELGRWTILLELRRDVLKGNLLTAQQVNEACVDHVRKQRAGMKSATMRMERDSGQARLFEIRRTAKPISKEWKAANDQIERLDHQQRKRAPDDRHRQRMAALYIDDVSDTQWRRPEMEVSAMQACNFITDAMNDYSGQYQRYTNLELLKPEKRELHDAQQNNPKLYDALQIDLELYNALQAWTDRPQLPPPRIPLE